MSSLEGNVRQCLVAISLGAEDPDSGKPAKRSRSATTCTVCFKNVHELRAKWNLKPIRMYSKHFKTHPENCSFVNLSLCRRLWWLCFCLCGFHSLRWCHQAEPGLKKQMSPVTYRAVDVAMRTIATRSTRQPALCVSFTVSASHVDPSVSKLWQLFGRLLARLDRNILLRQNQSKSQSQSFYSKYFEILKYHEVSPNISRIIKGVFAWHDTGATIPVPPLPRRTEVLLWSPPEKKSHSNFSFNQFQSVSLDSTWLNQQFI